jgi:hypothetical protein
MGWLFTFPLVLIVIAIVLSFVFVRLSWVHITNAGVEVRNFPAAPFVVPLDQVERFVDTEPSGFLQSIRPATAALVRTDGSRVPVRRLHERGGAFGVEAMNARVATLRAH